MSEDGRAKLIKYNAKIGDYQNAPFFPNEVVDDFVKAVDNLMNRADARDWFVALQKALQKDYVQDIIKEYDIKVPISEEDALKVQLEVSAHHVSNIHRYLDNNFFYFIREYIKYHSMVYDAGKGWYDARNAVAVNTCKFLQLCIDQLGTIENRTIHDIEKEAFGEK